MSDPSEQYDARWMVLAEDVEQELMELWSSVEKEKAAQRESKAKRLTRQSGAGTEDSRSPACEIDRQSSPREHARDEAGAGEQSRDRDGRPCTGTPKAQSHPKVSRFPLQEHEADVSPSSSARYSNQQTHRGSKGSVGGREDNVDAHQGLLSQHHA